MTEQAEKVPSTDVDVVTVPEWGALTPAEFATAIRSKDTQLSVSPDEVQAQMMARIANAVSIEDMLKEMETIKAEDVIDRVFTANDFHLNNSDPKYGQGVYGVIDVVLDGKAETLICGGEKVLMQLYKAKYEQWLPADLVLRRSKEESAKGFHWLYLELPGSGEEPF